MPDNSEFSSRGQSNFIVSVTTITLATFFVVARLISRLGILRICTADDWFIILAWVIAIGLSFSTAYGNSIGFGARYLYSPVEWLPTLRKSEYAFSVLYNPALMATKTSILIFYIRIASNTQNFLRIASSLTLALVNISGLVLTFLNAFRCDPISAAFRPGWNADDCRSIVTLYLSSAPINIFTDLTILVLPIPALTGMRIPSRQKTILVATYSLGVFVTVVDLVRIYYLQEAVLTHDLRTNELGFKADFAWSSSTAFMWSTVEVNVGIICACIPTLKPLFRRVLPPLISRTGEIGISDIASLTEYNHRHINNAEYSSNSVVSNVEHPLPTLAARAFCDEENQVNIIDFLSTPRETLNAYVMHPARSVYMRGGSKKNTCPGFFNMNHPKSMLKTQGWESFKYCAIVTTLFSLWGFSYGLLNTLNTTISSVTHPLASHSLSLGTAYFSAYFIGALTVGQYMLRFFGFKEAFITGLAIYGTGTLMFWPSAVLTSYTGFMLSNFVVGFGLAVLETAANPFLALCGPDSMSEFRLLVAQGVQATVVLLSQLLADKVFFDDNTTLIELQWTYLAVTLFTVVLALFFHYMPLPEVTDTELAQRDGLDTFITEDLSQKRRKCPYRNPIIAVINSINKNFTSSSLLFFVMAQFLYVSAQESLSVFCTSLFASFADNGIPIGLTLTKYNLLAHMLFAVGRFLFAPLCLIFAPRILLLIAFSLSLIIAVLIAALPMSITTLDDTSYSPSAIFPPITLLLFFTEGPIFPLLFSMGLRKLGSRTKSGAAYLTAATSGGGVFPWVMLAIQNRDEKIIAQDHFWVLVTLFAIGFLASVLVVREGKNPGTIKRRIQVLYSQLFGITKNSNGLIPKKSENCHSSISKQLILKPIEITNYRSITVAVNQSASPSHCTNSSSLMSVENQCQYSTSSRHIYLSSVIK
ncbi:hypothetical protein Golomagni_01049 [Golovinomyces magnicellulatus]|nr:hypothetical protein Golomagni_01049 [Golovinomyces magnicellulatus]